MDEWTDRNGPDKQDHEGWTGRTMEWNGMDRTIANDADDAGLVGDPSSRGSTMVSPIARSLGAEPGPPASRPKRCDRRTHATGLPP